MTYIINVPCPRGNHHHLDSRAINVDYFRATDTLVAGWHDPCTDQWQTVSVPRGIWADLVGMVGRVGVHDTPAEVGERPDGPPFTAQDEFAFSTMLELVRNGWGDSERWDIGRLVEAFL